MSAPISTRRAVDVGPLYVAADTVADCAARVRTQQVLLGLQGATVAWWGIAAIACRGRLDEISAALGLLASRLDELAESIRRTAAAAQLATAVHPR